MGGGSCLDCYIYTNYYNCKNNNKNNGIKGLGGILKGGLWIRQRQTNNPLEVMELQGGSILGTLRIRQKKSIKFSVKD